MERQPSPDEECVCHGADDDALGHGAGRRCRTLRFEETGEEHRRD
jgi:hypothetical protein